jgi:carbohydrate-selective porin OprB
MGFPADTRGYTAGTVIELTMKNWSLRGAMALEPTTANGPHLDWNAAKNRGVTAEGEWRHNLAGRSGSVRLLACLNRANAGNFRQALLSSPPDLVATRRNGTKKYGFGINFDQAITTDIGAFGRYGWNDGKTESFAFTQIDRTVTGGVDIAGKSWRRPADHADIAVVRNYLSRNQRTFLGAGGIGFIIGDGRLNYRPETILEAFYGWHATKQWTFTLDYQRIQNPAYNQDRGPVNIVSIRFHWEI